jgi:membrane-bound serine protease (ClpP class)
MRRISSFGVSVAVRWSLMTAWVLLPAVVFAQNAASEKTPLGQFVTIKAPLSDSALSQIHNRALELQSRAARESRSAILILELESGSSRFGQVRDLAGLLSSADLSSVRTVAWIPRSLRGNHVVLALACQDVVMRPDGEIGDIGRGEPVDPADQAFILSLGDRRRNPRLSLAVIQAMLDSKTAFYRVTARDGAGQETQRFVDSDELRQMQQQGIEIPQAELIREAGSVPVFVAADSRKAGFLVTQTASSRPEVAEIYGLPRESMREKPNTGGQKVRMIEVSGVVSVSMRDFVLRELRNAQADQVNLLVLDIDSPGGDKSIAEEIALRLAEINPEEMNTVAWISRGAWSGGALIAFGCAQIYMHPDAQIGDIGVIAQTAPGGAFERAPEKIISPFLEFATSLARRRNRAPALLQAMIDRDLEVFEVTNRKDGRVTWMSEPELQSQPDEWTKGPMVPETRRGLLLTLRGERAHQLQLTERPCNDLAELQTRLGLSADVLLKPVKKSWVDNLVSFLNSSFGAFLLVAFGLLCVYIEAHVPSGMFAIPAVLCAALFFWSRFLGGTAGSLELVLFLLGIGLLALEIFLIPGFGVFGVSGILLTIASLVMASHTFSGITATQSFEKMVTSLTSIGAAMITVLAVAVFLSRFLPSIPWVNRLILTPPGYASEGDGPTLHPSLYMVQQTNSLVNVGQTGVCSSALRPAGKVNFGDRFLDVVSDGAYIDAGTTVEVIHVTGNRIVVRSCLV